MLCAISGVGDPITCLDAIADRILATGSAFGCVAVWELRMVSSSRPVAVVERVFDDGVRALCLPDEQRICAVFGDQVVRKYDFSRKSVDTTILEQPVQESHTQRYRFLAMQRNCVSGARGIALLPGSSSHTLFDLDAGHAKTVEHLMFPWKGLPRDFDSKMRLLWSEQILPPHRFCLIGGGGGAWQRITAWQLPASEDLSVRKLSSFRSQMGSVGLQFVCDESDCIVGANRNSLSLLSSDGRILSEQTGSGRIVALKAGVGQAIYSVTADGGVSGWDASDGKLQRKFSRSLQSMPPFWGDDVMQIECVDRSEILVSNGLAVERIDVRAA